jgi:2-isopropylmalate synthase
MPSHRYTDVYSRVAVPLAERTWPSRRLERAPLWVPVDLRDGNQALAEPMDPTRKRRFFQLLVAMGYKEIEAGYPSASQTDYDFVRLIVETAEAGEPIAPDDVTIVVFTPARRELIERTVESVRGIRNPVVIHMYAATAPTWREVVLGHDREALKRVILGGAADILRLTGDAPDVRYEFSPEVFNLTEPDYVLQVCDEVTQFWDASPERPVILNLPATVEVATPNVYADQIEYMHRNLARRDSVILSVHPHNDRGTGIACAELAMLAGAQRVEGCVFGNGERTGNVDLATLALNLHAQGIDPMIDFSDIDEVRRTVEHCTRMPVHDRHPYVGDLVHTAFSGTHQDAIRKGFAEHRARAEATGRASGELEWRVPYLPIDPADIGRSYDAVVRVNSQSGKGGIAYLLESEYGLSLPRRLQIDFARHVQRHADLTGEEVTAEQLWMLFQEAYLRASAGDDEVELLEFDVSEEAGGRTGSGTGAGTAGADVERTRIRLRIGGAERETEHVGLGPVEALTQALAGAGVDIEVLSLTQMSTTEGASSDAVTVLEFRDGRGSSWAAGRDRSVLKATLSAVLTAAEAVRSRAVEESSAD